MTQKQNSPRFILLFAATLSAFAALTIDLYLPALPILATSFNTNPSDVQLSLTFSLIGLACGQLLFGPISDKFGRKAPLMISLLAFVLATGGCIYAWNITSFNFFRLLQGFAGAGRLVISRSIAVDLYEGEKLSQFLSSLAVIIGLAPIVAPIAGGFLLDYTDWKGIFIVLLFLGIIISGSGFFYQETLVKNKRLQGNITETFATFGKLFKNSPFVCYVLVIELTMGMFFSYLSSSPFIFQKMYQVSTSQYGILL